jgi:hypothetical protein
MAPEILVKGLSQPQWMYLYNYTVKMRILGLLDVFSMNCQQERNPLPGKILRNILIIYIPRALEWNQFAADV